MRCFHQRTQDAMHLRTRFCSRPMWQLSGVATFQSGMRAKVSKTSLAVVIRLTRVCLLCDPGCCLLRDTVVFRVVRSLFTRALGEPSRLGSRHTEDLACCDRNTEPPSVCVRAAGR